MVGKEDFSVSTRILHDVCLYHDVFFYISPLLSGGFAGQVDQSMCSCSSQDDTARVSVQNQFVEVA